MYGWLAEFVGHKNTQYDVRVQFPAQYKQDFSFYLGLKKNASITLWHL